MDYSYQLERLEMLLKALEFIIDQLAEFPVDYPIAMRAYNSVLFGLIPRITMPCPHCQEEFTVTANAPCGGISDALDLIEEAIDCIVLEMQYDQPAYKYPADYSI